MDAVTCDVLLINSPSAYRLPPFSRKDHIGIGYLTSVLRANGISVRILDAPLLDWDVGRTLAEIAPISARVVGISALQAQAGGVVGLIKGLRSAGCRAPIVLGGQFSTFCYDRLLADFPEIDFIVRGEGEMPFLDLVQRLLSGQTWQEVPGLAYRRNGEITANPLAALIADLDSLPSPARDTLAAVEAVGGLPAVSSSRGCPARCTFCSTPTFYRLARGPAWRQRSARSVVEEIERLVKDHGVRRVMFVDDNFIGVGERGKQRAREIAEGIIRAGLNIEFLVYCRVTDVETDLFSLLKRAGLTDAGLGVESGVQRQLDTYGKATTVEDNRRAIKLLQELGINPGIGFIMADPYLTAEELLENMRFLKQVGLKLSDLTFPLGELWLFDGTPIIERLRQEGRVRGDYLRGYSYVPVHRTFYAFYRAAGWLRNLIRPAPKRPR